MKKRIHFLSLIIVIAAFLSTGNVLALNEAPGFPITSKSKFSRPSPVVDDLDNDGSNELVAVATNYLYIWDSYGVSLAEFKLPKGQEFVSTPTIGDINGDGKKEIIAVTKKGVLYALNLRAQTISGFPYKLKGKVLANPSLIDANSDNKMEICIGTKSGNFYIIKGNGKVWPKYPKKLGSGVISTAAVGDLNSDGKVDMVVGLENGDVHAFSVNQRSLSGFPFSTNFTVSSQPIIADLDKDYRFELIIISQDFKVYAVENNGSLMDGFPVTTKYRIYGTGAVADVDGDGNRDIIVPSGDNNLYVFDKKGKLLPGFPFKTKGRIFSSVVVGDIDRNGTQEIVFTSNDGNVYVVRNNGRRYPGFPEYLGGKLSSTPVLTDFDGNGSVEIIVTGANKKMFAWRITAKAQKVKLNLPWPAEGHDPYRSGRLHPNEALLSELLILPDEPRVSNRLKIKNSYFDLDNPTEKSGPNIRTKWYRDDILDERYSHLKQLPPGSIKKGERWHFTLQDGDNWRTYGEKKGAIYYTSSSVEILNTLPTKPKIVVSPNKARTTVTLKTAIPKSSNDADRDKITYHYNWYKDGTKQDFPYDTRDVSAKYTTKGEKWKLIVIPHDGEQFGPESQAESTIINTPPQGPGVIITPENPTINDVLQVSVKKEAKDDDHDPIIYKYNWYVNGKFQSNESQLALNKFKKGDDVKVKVVANDGEVDGGVGYAAVKIHNLPPYPPVVTITPASPQIGDDLKVEISQAATDADGDKISYLYKWYKNDQEIKLGDSTRIISGQSIRKDQVWKVEVFAFDSRLKSAPAGHSVVVANSVPKKPKVKLSSATVYTNSTLKIDLLTNPFDPDGDKVEVRYRWFKNDQRQSFAENKSKLSKQELFKHDKWRAEVFGFDGSEDGEVAKLEFKVKNTPPTGCRIKIGPAKPFTIDGLRVEFDRESTDADNDSISYQYLWKRNGKTVTNHKGMDITTDKTKKGEKWEVYATPFDGEQKGPVAVAAVYILNTLPAEPEVTINNQSPAVNQEIQVDVSNHSFDPDGDKITYNYLWYYKGKVQDFLTGKAKVKGFFKKDQTWKVKVVPFDGQGSGKSAEISFTAINTPPTSPEVKLTPGRPNTRSDLRAQISKGARDIDGDKVQYRYEWYRDGSMFKDVDGATLSGKYTTKGQEWKVLVYGSDGEMEGGSGQAVVKVVNSAPSSPVAEITPAKPKKDDQVSCSIKTESRDIDSDSIQYRYKWFKNGKVESGSQGSSIYKGDRQKGDRLKCQVKGFDGQVESGAGIREVRVLNTVPTAPQVEVGPSAPRSGEELKCQVVGQSFDADGDKMTYVFAWKVNEKAARGVSGSTVPKGKVKKGEQWQCFAYGSDGASKSGKGEAQVQVINSAPTSPEVKLIPGRPNTRSDLRAQISKGARDIDGDKVQYRYEWYRDGSMFKDVDGATLSGKYTTKGQEWKVLVYGSDGEMEGGSGQAVVKVVNSAPSSPVAEITPAKPKKDDQVSCSIKTESRDIDSDSIQYRYKWFKNGKVESGSQGSSIYKGDRQKGDRLKCQVKGFDGQVESGAGIREVIIREESPRKKPKRTGK